MSAHLRIAHNIGNSAKHWLHLAPLILCVVTLCYHYASHSGWSSSTTPATWGLLKIIDVDFAGFFALCFWLPLAAGIGSIRPAFVVGETGSFEA